jgi:hypothetical protein
MKKLKSFFLIFLIALTNGQSVYAANEFDATFFSLNDINYYDAGAEECISSSGTTLVGSDNIEKVWNFFKSKGLPDTGVAGLIGGKWGETGGSLNPKAIQSGQPYDEARAMNPSVGNYAFGVAQWDFGRRVNLLNYAKEKGQSWDTLELQLDFMWQELNSGYTDVLNVLKTGTLEEAVKWWIGDAGWGYERPDADVIASRNAEGVTVGKQLIALYGGKSASSSSSSDFAYTFLGDSITVGVKSQLESNFSGSNVKAEVGQGVDWAVGQLASDIKDSVVINLGTNDKFTNGKNLLDKLKDKKKVYIVNIYGAGGSADFEATNKNISELIKDYSNVQLLDWKAYVDQNGGRDKFYAQEAGGANYHLNTEGNDLYIKFLKEKIAGSSSSSNSCETSFAGSGEATLTTKDGFSIFYQTDKRWADVVYHPGLGYQIGPAGCGPTAMTMILVAFGISVNPKEVALKATEMGQVVSGGALGTQASVLAKHYGLQSEQISLSVDAVNKHLDQGHLIWMGGAGIEPPFTTGGHMIVVRKKLANGNWLIANPYDYPYNKSVDNDPMKEFNPSTVMSSSNMATAVWK